jgi:hypothetical protein
VKTVSPNHFNYFIGVHMKITVIDSKTGKEIQNEISDPNPSFFDFVNGIDLSDAEIKLKIDQMNVSADVKALLYSFSKATIRAGKAIVKVGRKIIDIIFAFTKAFPFITFGIIFGLVVGALITAIPLLGILLGSVVTKLAIIFGVVLGAKKEYETADFGMRIEELIAQFSPLKT